MNVSLTPQLEKFVQKLVKSGEYQTASEVVRDGLRELREKHDDIQRRHEILRREIAKGIESADKGNVKDSEEVFDRLLKRARAAVVTKSKRKARAS